MVYGCQWTQAVDTNPTQKREALKRNRLNETETDKEGEGRKGLKRLVKL